MQMKGMNRVGFQVCEPWPCPRAHLTIMGTVIPPGLCKCSECINVSASGVCNLLWGTVRSVQHKYSSTPCTETHS